ncbi:MAG: hypothetical protein ACOC2A_00475 [Halanaeroarchaeum sp.]
MLDGIGDRPGWGRQVHLGVALGTLVAGIVAFASGAAKVGADALHQAGLPAGVAVEVAAAGAALVPIGIVVAVLLTVDAEARFARYAVASAVAVVTGIAVALTSSSPLANPVAIGLYGGGLVVLLGVLVGGVLDASASLTRRDRPRVEYVDRGSTDHVMPSDGGEEDDDIEFLLDDEE